MHPEEKRRPKPKEDSAFLLQIFPMSGMEKRLITKGVFSLEESLESLKSLNSLESLQKGGILFCFPHFVESLESLDFLSSLVSLESRERAERCFESAVLEERTQNSLSSAANSVSSARNSVSSRLHTTNGLKGTH